MSEVQTSTFTESALSDKVKDFLNRFKDKFGNYKYLEQIDEMMPKNSKYILVDYNDLVMDMIGFVDNEPRTIETLLTSAPLPSQRAATAASEKSIPLRGAILINVVRSVTGGMVIKVTNSSGLSIMLSIPSVV